MGLSVDVEGLRKLTEEFDSAFSAIKEVLENKVNPESLSGPFDRMLVKQNLAKADLLLFKEDGSIDGGTFYIALTTKMRGFLPVFSDDRNVYLNPYKHPFRLIIDDLLFDEKNIRYLADGKTLSDAFVFENGLCKTSVSVKERAKTSDDNGDENQTHLGVDIHDPKEKPFTEFRKLLNVGDCLVGLKIKGEFKYLFFGIKKDDAEGLKGKIKEKFFFNGGYEQTDVDLSSYVEEEVFLRKDSIPEKLSIKQLATILGTIYKKAGSNDDSLKTPVHMFSIKYAKYFPSDVPSIGRAIINEANMLGYEVPATYHTEIQNCVRIYNAIAAGQYGFCFTDEKGSILDEKLPRFEARTRKKYPLNRIFYGAPGTGKTYSTALHAVAVCCPDYSFSSLLEMKRDELMKLYNKLCERNRISFVTFHQSYGYEEFVQGIRPVVSNGNMVFDKVDGAFKKIVSEALHHPELDYAMIIDEINRGNISKIFGELITLIEEDKRWGEVNGIQTTLPSGDWFAIPNNLYIIGTMNSADKSISLIDAALRRRFEFVEVMPNADMIENPVLKGLFSNLNRELRDKLKNTDSLIGHSYFMNKKEDDFDEVLNNKVIPLLYEYLYDVQSDVEAVLSNSIKGTPFRIAPTGNFSRLRVEKIAVAGK